MFSFDIIAVFLVVLFLLISLYSEFVRPGTSFFIAIVILNLLGILTPSEVLHGFGNEQLAVIIFLIILGKIFQKRPLIDAFFSKSLEGIKTRTGLMIRMLPFVAVCSAFLNNTPLVAMLMPYLHSWGKRNDVAPSKLLIPLSYAAILGGCATLIGTSTNLIINSLVVEEAGAYDLQPLSIFDFSLVGVPMIVIGLLYILLADKLLPSRRDVLKDFEEKPREYIVETLIAKDSQLIGKTVEDAHLRHLKGLYLTEILREGQIIAPVSPERDLHEGDVLIFAGETETIADLVKPLSGLTLPDVVEEYRQKKIEIMEVVIAYNSSMIGKKIRYSDFRGKYDAAILAVHRNGERLSGKIGELVLKAGDVMLIVSGGDFGKGEVEEHDFYFISKIREIPKYNVKKSSLLIGGTILAILLAIFNVASLFQTLLVLLSVLLLFKVTTLADIKASIDYDLIIIIALGLAMGAAMIKTGAADLIATSFVYVFEPLGVIGLMFGIFLISNLLSAFMFNAAAAVIIFPISLSIAVTMNLNPMPFILLVAYGVGTSFMTPIGYQTNLMVYGPGGYTFKDFFRIGFPLTLIYMVVCVLILGYVYDLF
ncbi:MAG: SLC13 family permease [Bacteroidetes bacterium]|nr:MAG: SLC13 family permease [Bacteroidota bacterium]